MTCKLFNSVSNMDDYQNNKLTVGRNIFAGVSHLSLHLTSLIVDCHVAAIQTDKT